MSDAKKRKACTDAEGARGAKRRKSRAGDDAEAAAPDSSSKGGQPEDEQASSSPREEEEEEEAETEEAEDDNYEENQVDDGVCNFCGHDMDDDGALFVVKSRDSEIMIPAYMAPYRHFCDGDCLFHWMQRFRKDHGTFSAL